MFLLKSLITAVNWEILLANTANYTNVDTMVNSFYDTFWSICEKCVPIVISSRRINKSNYPHILLNVAVNANGCQNVNTLSLGVCYNGEQHNANISF